MECFSRSWRHEPSKPNVVILANTVPGLGGLWRVRVWRSSWGLTLKLHATEQHAARLGLIRPPTLHHHPLLRVLTNYARVADSPRRYLAPLFATLSRPSIRQSPLWPVAWHHLLRLPPWARKRRPTPASFSFGGNTSSREHVRKRHRSIWQIQRCS